MSRSSKSQKPNFLDLRHELYKMWFPESPYKKNKIEVKLNLENYATKMTSKQPLG